ncbi:hypothetical protein GPJ56_003388 [Histomonas meleagridis]|uniref:uncharacterized protein n=1 Tax=Histomonas meleagridis TaxID=135588 RepID=UPI0035596BDD|nr:hypothetical protein GPJ56_003388 [Histomonas meleagridis]KAH0805007.1 hypothetical protein GO595_001952 [Histomonas meleagridis]
MEKCISHLFELVSEYENLIVRITQSPKTEEPIDALKKEAIHIEGQISQGIENLRHQIHIDDRIPSEERENQLNAILNENGINLSQLKIRRRAAIDQVNKELAEMKVQESIEARQRLLGDATKDEIRRTINLKNQNTLAVATDATARLERTRNIIKAQVQESQQSIELMRESTQFLEGINDATSKVESAQNKASRSLARLRVSQNFDKYFLKFSIFVFICSVIFVVISNIRHNVIVDVFTYGYRKLKRKDDKTLTPTPTQQMPSLTPTPTHTQTQTETPKNAPTQEQTEQTEAHKDTEPSYELKHEQTEQTEAHKDTEPSDAATPLHATTEVVTQAEPSNEQIEAEPLDATTQEQMKTPTEADAKLQTERSSEEAETVETEPFEANELNKEL